MPVLWTLQEDTLILTYVGDPSIDERQLAVDAAMAHPSFRTGSAVLFDIRSALWTVPSEELQRRVDWAVSLVDRGFRPRYALVAAAGREGIANRGAQLLAGKVEVCTFHTMEQAVEWLKGD